MEPIPNKPVKSHRIDATPKIPLRPELIACMDPQSLGRYSCASVTLRKEVFDSKAWELMANAQKLRSARDAALAAERDAVARVKSQVLRRRLADSMSRAPAPHRLAPNKLDDFAFFVRFEEDGRVLWEGEMAVMGFVLSEFSSRKFVELSMSEARSAIKASASFTDVPDDDDEYWHRVRFTLIALRDEDRAMIPLGSFRFAEDRNDPTFYSPQALYQTEQNEILLELIVNADDGELNSLELSVELHDRTVAKVARHERWLDDLTKRQVEYLLTHLAGAYDYRSRPHALATIGNWFNDARREF